LIINIPWQYKVKGYSNALKTAYKTLSKTAWNWQIKISNPFSNKLCKCIVQSTCPRKPEFSFVVVNWQCFSDSVVSDSAVSDSAVSDSGVSDSAVSDSVFSDIAVSDSVVSDSVV